jgi:glutamyl-Q tRNA(Asp) synthetase
MVAAMGSWLDARSQHGQWLVRIDDLDPPRVVRGAVDDILRTLEGFGLTWDGPVIYQSERNHRYQEALATLIDNGDVFPCFCSRKDLQGAPVYPGTCRHRTDYEGRTWRFRVGEGNVKWADRYAGHKELNCATDLGDFLVRGVEEVFSYHLANVVDDADFGITDVIRGADLMESTGCHIVLQRALQFKPVQYGHLPLALSEDGIKLSKQTHARPLEVAEASACIQRVLEHLGMPSVELDAPAVMLSTAVSLWRSSSSINPRGRQ